MNTDKTIYIAGPMRGLEFYNFPEFDDAADRLQLDGWRVVSPADIDRGEGFSPYAFEDGHDWNSWPESLDEMQKVIERDLEAVLDCDAIYMLEGWENSTGAKAELAVAKWAEKEVLYEGSQSSNPPLDWTTSDSSGNFVFPKTIMPEDAAERKRIPLYSGLLKYFPDALIAVARCSQDGNDQHHKDKPLHWDKSKSSDELDALMRHILDEDWEKVAWRALANCQRMIDAGYNPLLGSNS